MTDDRATAERDVATARAALASTTDRYYRRLAGASAIADAEARLDRALDALDAAQGYQPPPTPTSTL